MKEVPLRAGVSTLASSQTAEVEASLPMVGGDPADQRNDTTREYGGDPSDGFDLCVVPAPLRSLAFVSRSGAAPGASGRPLLGLEDSSTPPRIRHELQSERERREPSVGQPRVQIP